MTAGNSIKARGAGNSPLYLHKSGHYAKKIKGRVYYFGKDRSQALEKYYREKPYLEKGIRPPVEADARRNVGWLFGLFLEHFEGKVATGEKSPLSFRNYLKAARHAVEVLGKTTPIDWLQPHDFAKLRRSFTDKPDGRKKRKGSKAAEGVSLKSIERRVAEVRAVFHYGEKNALFEKPLIRLWGTEFDKPSKKAIRKAKVRKFLEREEILELLGAAEPLLRALILLAVNTGIGNADLGGLQFEDLDLRRGWLDKSRQKTGVERRAPLWPETVEAIRAYLETRPKPESPADFVFLAPRTGSPLGVRLVGGSKENIYDPISQAFDRLRKKVGLEGRGKSFYALRHVVETVGGEARDQIALDRIMGHVSAGMGTEYRERISDERLIAVSETIREWLFESTPKKPASRKGVKR